MTYTSRLVYPAATSRRYASRTCPGNSCAMAYPRSAYTSRIEDAFPQGHVDAALDLLHLADLAWHDCYGPREVEIPPGVLDDILLLAHGDLARLTRVARQAVIDFRDVRVAADRKRAGNDSSQS